ncbi:MAG: radical SAM peptide maturase [Porphyromonadaceae bacterium]|nr:MAG: radical SAM peptide maturase [Porphyromonadaceae bacterium]
MRKSPLFTTQFGNTYIYNSEKKLTTISNSLLNYFIRIDSITNSSKKDNKNPSFDLTTPFLLKFPEHVVKYYLEKYLFLKRFGFVNEESSKRKYFSLITSKDINESIANLNQITFEVTDFCNLSCKYCGYGDFYTGNDSRNATVLSFETAVKVIEFLRKHWYSALNKTKGREILFSFYGGEPLLNMKLIKQVVKYLQQNPIRDHKIKFSMTTNGTLLEKYIKYLIENDFRLLVSLDGDENNNSYRLTKNGMSSFSKILSNLKDISHKFPMYYENNISFNAVLHNRNSYEEIYHFFNNNLLKLPRVAELNTIGIKVEKIEEFNTMFKNSKEDVKSSNVYNLLRNKDLTMLPNTQMMITFLNNYIAGSMHNYVELFFEQNKPKYVPTASCKPFGKKIFITSKGNILPCERVDHRFTMGYVKEDLIKINLDNIAEDYNRILKLLFDQCSTCYLSLACYTCMFHIENFNGKLKCPGRMGSKEFKAYLSEIFSTIEEFPETYYKIMNEIDIID